MAETALGGRTTSPRRRIGLNPRTHRLGWAIAAALLLIAALIAFITARNFDHRYGPIQQGSFGGLYSERNMVSSADGFSYSLAPKAGVTGQLIASLDNLGVHSVKVTSIDTDDVVIKMQWSAYRMSQGGDLTGVNTRWQAFPAIVPANGTIRLLITIHHPDGCHEDLTNPVGSFYTGIHTVHWQSLLHDHTTVIDDGLRTRNIRVC